MAYYSWVEAELRCPTCATVLDDLVWFGWGGVRSPNASIGPRYRPGERLLWYTDARGQAPADAFFGEEGRYINVGDPTEGNVDVFADGMIPGRCQNCGDAIGASVVELRDFVIAGVRAVRLADTDGMLHARIFTDATAEEIDFEIIESAPLRLIDD